MSKLKPVHCYLIIIGAGIVLFFNTLQNQFVFDDESVVQGNESIQSLSSIPKYFTADEGFHKVIGKYYRPIVSSTYAIDYALWKLDPYGFHITNVIIHIIACLFLFALLYEIFKESKYGLIASLAGTLIFLAHPIHTEAVSWVSGRTDSMVTVFFFASFLYYVKYVKSREDKKSKDDPGRMLMWSLIFYSVGLLCKEMIVTMPVVIILFDLLYRGKSFDYLKNNRKAYSWFIGITVVYLLIRYLLLKDIPDRESYLYFYGKDTVTAIATMLKTLPVYLKLLFFPVGLLYHYNGHLSDAGSFFEGGVLLSILLIVGLIALAVVTYKKKEGQIAFCISFFFLTLLPVMNIIPTMSLMAERFLYMTSFTLSLLIAYLIVKYITAKNMNAVLGMSLAVIIIFSVLTFERNKDWKDNDTLYATADGVDGTVLLVNSGNMYANRKQYEEAAKRFRRAIEIRENSILAHHNLGLVYFLTGQLDSAEKEISRGIELDPLAPDGYFQLANLYRMKGELPKAIEKLEKLQEVSPNYRDSKKMLDELKMLTLGDDDPSMKTQPQFGDDPQTMALEQRSFEEYNAQNYEESIRILEKLVVLAPGKKSGYLNNIGVCYEEMGDNDKAMLFYKKAMTADENNLNAYGGMASIYLKQGNRSEAIKYYEKILEKKPDDQVVINKLDSLRALK